MIKSIVRFSTLLLVVAMGAACSTLTTQPVKPTVELVSIEPLNIDLSEQKLRFSLKITNPNSFNLPVDSVDFVARFNDTPIASGKSKRSTVIPANGEALLALDVTAGIDRLMTTLQTFLHDESLNMSYELSGTVEIDNWASPIPFDVSGEMDIDNQ